ncbi:MAG: AI-2E family transporter [Spongiibacteraceae bacterium]|jgi:predicted PurR-regulated permease PerM|nr:AI-2E family transporter [Spongiibacteraceae bacterium]
MQRQTKLEDRAFLLALVAVTLVFFLVLKPFFAAIFWAGLLAILFYPVYRRLLYVLHRRRNRAALLTLMLSVIVVIVPLALIGTGIAKEGNLLYERVEAGELDPQDAVDWVRERAPIIETTLERLDIEPGEITERLSTAALGTSKFFATKALSIGQNTFQFMLSLILMLYLLFFFLRDGKRLLIWLMRALPLGDERERMLFAKFTEVARATIKGTLVIAVIQGLLGGLLFAAVGVQGALLWGVVMAVLSMLPAVGSALIWLPVGVYLLAVGDWVAGAVVLGVGAGVISVVDNILRPILVGRDTKLPDYLILLSTLGGIALMGMTGFLLGPVIAALFLAFWDIFIREYNAGHRPVRD